MSETSRAPAWRGYVALSLVWLAVVGALFLLTRRPSSRPIEILPAPTLPPTATPAATATPGPYRVDVAGAVRNPGVYVLPAGSIVADAINAAGGPAEAADLDRVNKAVPLQEAMQVYVPYQIGSFAAGSVTPVSISIPSTAPAGLSLININTATLEELDTLPGIGPARAEDIIQGRPYAQIEDIMRVSGIGQATFDKLKDRITVR